MNKKKKINVVVIFPVVVTVVLICGILYGVLQAASTPAPGTVGVEDIPAAYERVEADVHKHVMEEYP